MGRNVAASEDRLSENERTFAAALTVIETRYVDKVESDRLVYGAISGMLQTLDPHSNFMDPRRTRSCASGRKAGTTASASRFPRSTATSPSCRSSRGLRCTSRASGAATSSRRLTAKTRKAGRRKDAVKRLRGKKGTTVDVYLKRPGIEGLFKVDVERDEITIPTIPAEFMLDAQTGYVRLQDFAENTDRDLGRALSDLHDKGMKRLLLDIRGNPGGPLDQAIRVANRFLKKGDLIVYTRGRVPNSDADYRATEESDTTRCP